jgi:type II secretory ATPase GspE/PulE/Tfp pilus assembly ATPase PilB-like protein
VSGYFIKPMSIKKLIHALKQEGLMDKHMAKRFRSFEKAKQGNVLDFYMQQEDVEHSTLLKRLRDEYHIPVVSLQDTAIAPNLTARLPREIAETLCALPFYEDDNEMYVAFAKPETTDLAKHLSAQVGKSIIPFLAAEQDILDAVKRVYGQSHTDHAERIDAISAQNIDTAQNPESSASMEVMHHLIHLALERKASDVHVEPMEESVVVRFRIDGVLYEQYHLPKELHASLLARLKVLANLRLDEHQQPQDGRVTFHDDGVRASIRVSIVPTLHGEKAALRFLDTAPQQLSLEALGIDDAQRQQIKKLLTSSSGLVLVTGPTGSGKTTTLYAMLNELDRSHLNISTIEDPIEYHLDGVNQIQANSRAGLTFARGLRAILRQDPDIILVGEIRDRETAEIAINAALTGHLVLASLHTRNAAGAVPRLIDMGIEPYLITAALRAVVSQRLVRTLCARCKKTYTMTNLPEPLRAAQTPEEQRQPLVVAEATGCSECLDTGFIGRSGIFETMVIDESFHGLIIDRAPVMRLRERATQLGMRFLHHNALEKVRTHQTTPKEIARVIR